MEQSKAPDDGESANRTRFSGGMGIAVITSTAANAVGPISIAAIAPLLAHSLGPEGRGLVAAASVPFALLSAALTLGIPEALTFAIGRGILNVPNAMRSAQLVLLTCGIFAASIMWFLAPLVSVGSPTVTGLIRLSCVAFIPSQLMWAFRGRAQGLHQWNSINAEKILTGFFRAAAVGLLFIRDSLTVTSASIVLITAPLVGMIAYARRVPPIARLARVRSNETRILMGFGGKVWLGSVAGILLSRLDQVLIAPLSSAEQLGFYSIAVNVGDLTLFATSAACSVLMARESTDPTDSRVKATASLLFIAITTVTVPLCLTAYWWMPAIFGADFRPAAQSAIALLTSTVISSSGSLAGAVLTARGVPESRSRSLVYGLVVNVIMIFALVPTTGALGAALATMAGMLAMTCSNVAQLRSRFGFSVLELYLPSRALRSRLSHRIGLR